MGVFGVILYKSYVIVIVSIEKLKFSMYNGWDLLMIMLMNGVSMLLMIVVGVNSMVVWVGDNLYIVCV